MLHSNFSDFQNDFIRMNADSTGSILFLIKKTKKISLHY